MTPEVIQAWRDTLARMRYEREHFAQMAAQRRKDAIELRKRRRWLDALKADCLAMEYRRERDHYAIEIKRAKLTSGLR